MRWVLIMLILNGCTIQTPTKAINAYLKKCPIEEPKEYTLKEVLRVSEARKQSLIRCNEQIQKHRGK